jgi:hypothetical protein
MSCPTCGHTMQCFGTRIDGAAAFWCPRCGSFTESETIVHVPKLVERCRRFEQLLGPAYGAEWVRLGIGESINLPERRCEYEP